MKYLYIINIALCALLAMTSCEKVDITNDSNGDNESQTDTQTGKAYKVNIKARSASQSALTYPIQIQALDSNGNSVAQQTINSESEDISLKLTAGAYTITAISGSTDFSTGYTTTPLLIGHSDIDISNSNTSVNILLSYAVASLNVSMSALPSDATDVSLSISSQYTSITDKGEYSGSGKSTIPCYKSGDTWTTGTVYLLPGCAATTTMSLNVTSASGTETFSLTYPSPLKPSVPYTFNGTYSGASANGIKVTGTLSCGEWEDEVRANFTFGPSATNSFDNSPAIPTFYVSSLPTQGSIWDGHIVAYIDGSDAMLISMQEWSELTSALYEADPDVARNIASSYSEGDISSWSIPTSDQARLLRTAWKGDNLSALNTVITSVGGAAISLTEDNKNVRYLCEDATYTYSFSESSSVSAAGKTVKTYHLRLVKPVSFKLQSQN